MTRRFIASAGSALLVVLGAFAVTPQGAVAHEAVGERRYEYAAIEAVYEVHRDTTVLVREKLTYDFRGHYHKGYRNIPHNKIDKITDIVVRDAATGTALDYSGSTLDKNDPDSWGKYATLNTGGETVIEWYYDAADEQRAWVLEYVVHGSIGFHDGFDELYWNVFTDYDVPVKVASAQVSIPQPLPSGVNFRTAVYRDTPGTKYKIATDTKSVTLTASDFTPSEAFTIGVGWPEGIVDRAAYWRKFLLGLLPYAIASLIFLAAVVYSAAYWFYHERFNVGRGTIIPQYEPPMNLPPAMAEVIYREGISGKTWAATIVDLARRGHLSIEEKPSPYEKAVTYSIRFFMLVFVLGLVGLWSTGQADPVLLFVIPLYFIVRLGVHRAVSALLSRVGKEYILTKNETRPGDELREYERRLLGVLFYGNPTRFSTVEIRKKSASYRQSFAQKVQKLPLELYKDTEAATGAYANELSREHGAWPIAAILSVLFAALYVGVAATGLFNEWSFVFVSVIISALLVHYVRKYEARLNHEGNVLKEEILGFKLYLETAEKYRLQNLTPETFEKFLPYAMIFGVEKKWAKAFEGITMSAPAWYHGSVSHGGFASSSPAGGFSASSFASGFSASFASSFSSSSGSGSGGGGSSGGGGGGGGGGAS